MPKLFEDFIYGGYVRGKKVLEIYTDGASKGNPGESGIGVVLKIDEQIVGDIKKYIGEATNNVAEYNAVIVGLKEAKRLKFKRIRLLSDSELLIKQLTGEYKIKSEKLQRLFNEIKKISKYFAQVDINKISRDENKQADKLANQAVKQNKGIFPKNLP